MVCSWGNPHANVTEVTGKPLANLLQGVKGCLATLWQIFNSEPEGIGKRLTNSSAGVGNVYEYLAHICQKVANTLLSFSRVY
jgi:hypothetical protein